MLRINEFQQLIEQAAVHDLAVTELRENPDDSDKLALHDFMEDRDMAFVRLIDFVLRHGQMLRMEIMVTYAERAGEQMQGL